jgi:hypothetical protein
MLTTCNLTMNPNLILILGGGGHTTQPGTLRHRRRVRRDWLLTVPILRGLDQRELATINEALEEEHVPAGTWIVRQGELGERCVKFPPRASRVWGVLSFFFFLLAAALLLTRIPLRHEPEFFPSFPIKNK